MQRYFHTRLCSMIFFGRTIVFLVHSKLVARKLEVARASHPRGALARAFRGQKHFHLPSAAALQELGI